MPRVHRKIEADSIYHIFNRGNDRQRVFQKDGDYLAFLTLLGEMKQRYRMDLYAYCLMPNHFHLLVKAIVGEELSKGMQWFMTTHVRRYQRHYLSTGHLWQGRFKSLPVNGEEHFLTVTRYIEGNPVRAGLVESAENWVWSSHRGRRGLQRELLIEPLPVSFVGDWTTFVDTPLTANELAKVRKNPGRGWELSGQPEAEE
ncbi:transposase [Geomesophilobacter sediminis]|uniref:Transposase n=1 Tax=Geomesophilobacter sediminis TaxID=2798584 RepID=A0A8J7JN43_9BACT|nr:transposase [Geomesophilobacter sediminis]MBJ6726440.1 transposase [Geomesophilobacter sediminis]